MIDAAELRIRPNKISEYGLVKELAMSGIGTSPASSGVC
jgi:hypothetical protein